MNCPACKTSVLQLCPVDDRPDRLRCDRCNGEWIKGLNYWRWLHAHGQNLPERTPSAADPPVADSPQAKLCPGCGRLLRRGRVGHGVEFCIERCSACGGIWLDRNEWEVLAAHNLHDDLHFIFSAAWQQRVTHQEERLAHEKRVAALLGPAAFTRVSEFKHWAQTHCQRHVIMAYLADLDV